MNSHNDDTVCHNFQELVKVVESPEHRTYILSKWLKDTEIIDGGIDLTSDDDCYDNFRVEPQKTTTPQAQLVNSIPGRNIEKKLSIKIIDCKTYTPKDTTNNLVNKKIVNTIPADTNDSDDDVKIVSVEHNNYIKENRYKNKTIQSIELKDKKKMSVSFDTYKDKMQKAIQKNTFIDVKNNLGLIGIKVKPPVDITLNTKKENIKNSFKSKTKTTGKQNKIKNTKVTKKSPRTKLIKPTSNKVTKQKTKTQRNNKNNIQIKNTENSPGHCNNQISLNLSLDIFGHNTSTGFNNIASNPKPKRVDRKKPPNAKKMTPKKNHRVSQKMSKQNNTLNVSKRKKTTVQNSEIKKNTDKTKPKKRINETAETGKRKNNETRDVSNTNFIFINSDDEDQNIFKTNENHKAKYVPQKAKINNTLRKIRELNNVTITKTRNLDNSNKFLLNKYTEVHKRSVINIINNNPVEYRPAQSNTVILLNCNNNIENSAELKADQGPNGSITSPNKNVIMIKMITNPSEPLAPKQLTSEQLTLTPLASASPASVLSTSALPASTPEAVTLPVKTLPVSNTPAAVQTAPAPQVAARPGTAPPASTLRDTALPASAPQTSVPRALAIPESASPVSDPLASALPASATPASTPRAAVPAAPAQPTSAPRVLASRVSVLQDSAPRASDERISASRVTNTRTAAALVQQPIPSKSISTLKCDKISQKPKQKSTKDYYTQKGQVQINRFHNIFVDPTTNLPKHLPSVGCKDMNYNKPVNLQHFYTSNQPCVVDHHEISLKNASKTQKKPHRTSLVQPSAFQPAYDYAQQMAYNNDSEMNHPHAQFQTHGQNLYPSSSRTFNVQATLADLLASAPQASALRVSASRVSALQALDAREPNPRTGAQQQRWPKDYYTQEGQAQINPLHNFIVDPTTNFPQHMPTFGCRDMNYNKPVSFPNLYAPNQLEYMSNQPYLAAAALQQLVRTSLANESKVAPKSSNIVSHQFQPYASQAATTYAQQAANVSTVNDPRVQIETYGQNVMPCSSKRFLDINYGLTNFRTQNIGMSKQSNNYSTYQYPKDKQNYFNSRGDKNLPNQPAYNHCNPVYAHHLFEQPPPPPLPVPPAFHSIKKSSIPKTVSSKKGKSIKNKDGAIKNKKKSVPSNTKSQSQIFDKDVMVKKHCEENAQLSGNTNIITPISSELEMLNRLNVSITKVKKEESDPSVISSTSSITPRTTNLKRSYDKLIGNTEQKNYRNEDGLRSPPAKKIKLSDSPRTTDQDVEQIVSSDRFSPSLQSILESIEKCDYLQISSVPEPKNTALEQSSNFNDSSNFEDLLNELEITIKNS